VVGGVASAGGLAQDLPVFESGGDVFDAGSSFGGAHGSGGLDDSAGVVVSWGGYRGDGAVSAVGEDDVTVGDVGLGVAGDGDVVAVAVGLG
jgi:hypothetical protein